MHKKVTILNQYIGNFTLDNGYHLWTNTQGEGDIHLLALHGGPGGNHEYWEDTAEQLKHSQNLLCDSIPVLACQISKVKIRLSVVLI